MALDDRQEHDLVFQALQSSSVKSQDDVEARGLPYTLVYALRAVYPALTTGAVIDFAARRN